MIIVNEREIVISRYPNGEMNLMNLKYQIERSGDDMYSITWKYEGDFEIVLLKFIREFIRDNYGFSSCTSLNILYMPYSRMDRSQNGSVFTLEYAVRMIADAGFGEIIINEPHSEVTEKLFRSWSYSNIVIRNVSLELLQKAIYENQSELPYIVFYPDKGAMQRYGIETEHFLYGEKVRNFNTGEIESYKVKGNKDNIKVPFDVFIVDDLCSYGGTFIEASRKLRELGARKITLVVAHCENSVFKGKLFNHIDRLYTTNSILSANSCQKKISITDVIGSVDRESIVEKVQKLIGKGVSANE